MHLSPSIPYLCLPPAAACARRVSFSASTLRAPAQVEAGLKSAAALLLI
jgi:hypothetical protein